MNHLIIDEDLNIEYKDALNYLNYLCLQNRYKFDSKLTVYANVKRYCVKQGWYMYD